MDNVPLIVEDVLGSLGLGGLLLELDELKDATMTPHVSPHVLLYTISSGPQ